jgi:putative lipoprotein
MMTRLIGLAACLLLAACGEGPGSAAQRGAEEAGAMETLTGTVFYRERILLPPGFEVEVQLQDVSLADAPATVLASTTLTPDTGPPWPWSLSYDPAAIEDGRRYGLRATLRREGKLLFTTMDAVDPFQGDSTELLVRAVQRSAGPKLAGPTWTLVQLNGRAVGPGAGGRPVDLTLDAAESRAAGFSGCNRYTGPYSAGNAPDGSPSLSFGNMASTMMACPEGMDLEQEYLQTLRKATGYRIQDGTLALLDGEVELATFSVL